MSKLKSSKFLAKLINILLNILIFIFSIVLIVSLYTSIQVRVLGHKYANFFGYSMFEVVSDSMKPKIRIGDWILVKITKEVKINDVITFEYEGSYVTHRVVGMYGTTYVTKGDANKPKDNPIDKDQIIGKATKTLKGFGIVRKTILNPAVLIMLIITFFLFDSAFQKEGNENFATKKLKEMMQKFNNRRRVKADAQQKEPVLVAKAEQAELQAAVHEVLSSPSPEVEEPKAAEVTWHTDSIKEVNMDSEDALPINKDEEEAVIEDADFALAEEERIDEMDQTRMFRVIPVNVADYATTAEEIAQIEVIDEELPITEPMIEAEEEETEVLTNIQLELTNNNLHNTKNMIANMMSIKKEELNKIITILNPERVQSNEPTIKNTFINTYINAKYYNYYNNIDISGRTHLSKIDKIMKLVASDLIDSYKGTDTKYRDKVYDYADLFRLLINLDAEKETEMKKRKMIYRSEVGKFFVDWNNVQIDATVNEITKLQRTYDELTKYFLQKFTTEPFSMKTKRLLAKRNMFTASLNHSITFNKIYSEYIIEKTYCEGIIAEEKMKVLLTLLSQQLLRDMISGNFNQKYVIHMPMSLYTKQKKFWRLLQMIDDEYAKAHVLILVTYADLLKNKQYASMVKRLKKAGFRFALAFHEKPKLLPNGRGNLYIVNTIFVNKKDPHFDKVVAYIPEELLENIIYDDILNKIEDIGGIN